MRITGAVLRADDCPAPYEESVPLTVRELDLADPGPDEVLVQVEAAGVCRSDLSVVDGARPRPVPMLLGHEACGRVVSRGENVQEVEEGRRVVMTFMPRCGECEACSTEGLMVCPHGSAANAAGTLLSGERRLGTDGEVFHHCGVSGFATHAVVDRRSVVPVPEDVPPETAALFGCAVLTGGGAVKNRAVLRPGEDVIVVGAGGVGTAAALVAGAYGAGSVTVVDTVERKLAMARGVGADRAMTPARFQESGARAPVVIEAAGNGAAFELALEATAPGGRMASVGLASPRARAEISPLALVSESKTVLGSYLGSGLPERDIPEYIELWREGALPVERLVSSTIALGDINTAMDDLAEGRAMRQIIRC
ncbi:alcohol dehydrogenase catalytic domain-containing protein [Nocardiopsis salina]|uniref:alcohol dehydrogenase catalytic domain-containing protein n=1 Tax=Nocardiopsis salina TaxID=245836 RepID=UPI000477BD83|nr:alcohol dehydrogenase catalytic domain-containing protein [Nocardiopsis salina]